MRSMMDRSCRWCRTSFSARTLQVRRGLGLYCSKRCSAKARLVNAREAALAALASAGASVTAPVMAGGVECRAIPDWPGYRVGADGSVWTELNTHWRLTGQWRPMKTSLRPDGYVQVRLSGFGKRRSFKVHQIVLMAFVGMCPDGMESLHANNDRADNRVENLRYGTPKENAAERDLAGNFPFGPQRKTAKLSAADVRSIRRLREQGELIREIAARFGIGVGTVRSVLTGRTYRRVA